MNKQLTSQVSDWFRLPPYIITVFFPRVVSFVRSPFLCLLVFPGSKSPNLIYRSLVESFQPAFGVASCTQEHEEWVRFGWCPPPANHCNEEAQTLPEEDKTWTSMIMGFAGCRISSQFLSCVYRVFCVSRCLLAFPKNFVSKYYIRATRIYYISPKAQSIGCEGEESTPLHRHNHGGQQGRCFDGRDLRFFRIQIIDLLHEELGEVLFVKRAESIPLEAWTKLDRRVYLVLVEECGVQCHQRNHHPPLNHTCLPYPLNPSTILLLRYLNRSILIRLAFHGLSFLGKFFHFILT